jgi:hypothetical protein
MHHLLPPVLAVGWDIFLQILPFVIAVLVWVINRFATAAAQKPPPGRAAMGKPAAPPAAKPAGDPLRNEIDEFLRQAKAARAGQGAPPAANKPAMPGQQRGAPPEMRPGQPPIARPQRRVQPPPGKRVARRDETRQSPPPVRPPVIVEVVEAPQARESVAEHVAQAMDSEKFSRRATQLGQAQKASDDEFQQHMQRVFQHGLGNLNPEPAGIFEAAAATAAANASAATVRAAAAAGGKQTGTAPVATQKGASDISLFLAGRKNIRDAVILSEILKRPEERW